MAEQTQKLDIKPRILYQVAKAAWEGNLFERREEICRMVYEESENHISRQHIANQIRIAMGLNPVENGTVINEHDEEVLMGTINEPIIVANPSAYCSCAPGERACEKVCTLGAISHDEQGKVHINHDKCLGEGHCVQACSFGTLAEKSQFVPLIKLLQQHTSPVYASVAPAFAGQFGEKVTAGKFRSALLKLGFEDMVETALYADLVTMKEAFEFDEHVKTANDFMITSCCCPVWIKLIENKFSDLINRISPSVSPMVASARVIKTLDPTAKVVFIGPCIAKKSEAMLPDLKTAVDFVLTFQELTAIFAAANVNPEEQPDEENSLASWGGRVYGRTGGVSAAVETTLNKIVPRRAQKFVPLKVDGIPDCQKILEKIKAGDLEANFIEGMACKGGCVGGPGRLIPPEQGTVTVNKYGSVAAARTPVENPQVYSLLTRLGHGENIPQLTGTSPMANLLARKLKQE